jgi:FtsZ-interacting cell division protein ZipA
VESSAALSSKVSALEDEMRIIKGEVKQILTEIRSAVLAQDNPFEDTPSRPRPVQIVPAVVEEPARVEIVMPRMEHEAAPPPAAHTPHHEPAPHPDTQAAHPAPPEAHAPAAPPPAHAPAVAHTARWSLLTVANLAAWAEEAIQRVGAERLSILLDLCEVAGYLPPEARQALARVSELEVAAPERPASPMEVTVLLRQLDALLQGEHADQGPRLIY